MPTAELGNIIVHYQQQGSGPAVVLLHGLAEDHRSWAPMLHHLGEHSVTAIDLRGHGGTSAGDGDGTLEQLSDDLRRFLAEVTGPAVVIGYSLGGTIALHAASTGDTNVRGVIAVAASSVVGRAAADFFTGRIAQIEAGDWDEFGAGLRGDTAQQVVSEVDLDALTAYRLGALGDGLGYVNAARAMIRVQSAPLSPLLPGVATKVDVVGGDSDVFCPRKAADMIVDALPNGRYHEIAGAGHLISIDQPEDYGRLLARLLEDFTA
ncbi:MAG: alpha/beta fold hydrolase [Actinomycetia bacterium]|nr:alpha/beta fold hydrolase [Actinomycetes bacterium]